MKPEGPKGRQAEPHTHHGKGEETHDLIFSWLSWLAVLLMGAYARRRRRSRATWWPYSKKEVDRDIKPCFTVYFIDIGQPCYDQLTHVKTGYPLTSIAWSYREFKFTAHRTKCFLKLNADQLLFLFLIGSRAHVRLTCWKQAELFWSRIKV